MRVGGIRRNFRTATMTDLTQKEERDAWPLQATGKARVDLILALALFLMPAGKANAQFWATAATAIPAGLRGWGGYGGYGWGGYGYPGVAYNYGYPGYGMGNYPRLRQLRHGCAGLRRTAMAATAGWATAGYGGYGGMAATAGWAIGGFGYTPGGIGMSGVGYWNPMFGVGLTPLGNVQLHDGNATPRTCPAGLRRATTARPIAAQSSVPIAGQNRLPQ